MCTAEVCAVTQKEAWEIVGGLSEPEKMPCKSYGLPADECHVGALLWKVQNSTCSNCYAMKGQYQFPNVKQAQYRRLESLKDARWVDAMVTLIAGLYRGGKCMPYFRWHDSGDVQSMMHLRNIVLVCERTPNTRHWLPTREHKLVADYLAMYGSFPSNLTVRLSAHLKNSAYPGFAGLPTSSVHTTAKPQDGMKECRAYTRDGHCGACRACWNPQVACVSYHEH
jgi:Gene product 88